MGGKGRERKEGKGMVGKKCCPISINLRVGGAADVISAKSLKIGARIPELALTSLIVLTTVL